MIDVLLKLSPGDRQIMVRSLPIESGILIFKSIPRLSKILGLSNVPEHQERVKRRQEYINKFPDGVFWDELELITNQGVVLNNPKILISNKGDVVKITKKNRLYIVNNLDIKTNNIYRMIGINNKLSFLHRAIASTFIPIPYRIESIDYSSIIVNHKDHFKYNNECKNLEWVTISGNSRHALKQNNYKKYECLLFEVIVDNSFFGRKFIINRAGRHPSKEVKKCIGKILNGGSGAKGFNIIPFVGDPELYESGFPDDIMKLFITNSKYFQPSIRPVIGTVLVGKYKGLKFSFFGYKDRSQFFNQGNVVAVAKGQYNKTSGCSFRYGSHREAIPLHMKFNIDVLLDIKKHL